MLAAPAAPAQPQHSPSAASVQEGARDAGPRDESEEEEDDDEEEEKEKSLIVEGKREKKKVERLTTQVSSLQREPFTIPQGKGQKLCETERTHFFLNDLRNLHRLLYKRPGTVSSLKSVGQFCEMLKKFRNAIKLLKRILNFLRHPKSSGKPLPKFKISSSKSSKKERNSSGTTRKSKQNKCPEILSDESSTDEDEKKNKEESSEDKEKESERPPKKTSKKEKAKQKAAAKSTVKSVKSTNVKKAQESKQFQKKESESEDSSDDEPLIKKLKKLPTDEELKKTVKKFLANVNLEEVTMKQICKEVYENYPAYDLTKQKDFIKTTVKELIS
uniref:Protein DEK n=1 Tax=Cricetulus griseus TaxID=10029 RepID=A0A8C2M2R0_CRIGR